MIQHSGGMQEPEKDSIEGFNKWYAHINDPDRMNHMGLSILIRVENGEVTLIDIGS